MKIKSAQLSPRTLLHTLKNVVVVADPKRGVIIRSRPKRKVPRTEKQIQYSTRFGFAGVMASNSEVMQLQTAMEMAKGTEQVPRDILTMAALGTYYILENPDGTEWGHVSGPIWPGYQWKVGEMEFWTKYDTVNSTGYTTGAFCFKGNQLTIFEPLTIQGMKVSLGTLATATYQCAIGTYDGSRVITSITKSPTVLGARTAHNILYFPLPFTFNPGTDYFIMFGRTDGAGTYALPIATGSVNALQLPHTINNLANVANVNPAVGMTLSGVSTDCFPYGFVI